MGGIICDQLSIGTPVTSTFKDICYAGQYLIVNDTAIGAIIGGANGKIAGVVTRIYAAPVKITHHAGTVVPNNRGHGASASADRYGYLSGKWTNPAGINPVVNRSFKLIPKSGI